MHFLRSKYLITALLIGFIFFGLLCVVNTPLINNSMSLTKTGSIITPTESTNPASPVLLYDDSSDSESYISSGTSYYYRTYTMSTSDYHLIWLLTVTAYYNDFDLYLYSDASYSTLISSSTSTSQWDWIVIRPTTSQYTYPLVYTCTGTGGAYIEAESGDDIDIGTSYEPYLGSTEIGALYEVYFTSGTTYTVTLRNPSGCNLDLYVFRLISGTTTKLDYYSSISSSEGGSEHISFTPIYNDTYAIVILCKSGSGYATLKVIYGAPTIPAFDILPILMALTVSIYISFILLKNRKLHLY